VIAEHRSAITESDRLPESVDAAPANEPAVLDLDRIRSIREATARVQELLGSVLGDVDVAERIDVDGEGKAGNLTEVTLAVDLGDELEVIASAPGEAAKSGLPDSTSKIQMLNRGVDGVSTIYRGFCQVLIERAKWSKQDASDLARKHGVMLNAAMEVINEWAMDTYGDLLIEELREELLIHTRLLGDNVDAEADGTRT
jgi:hypothetical protein